MNSTYKESCESLAKKHGVEFTHLVGRTELYFGFSVKNDALLDLTSLKEVGISITLINRRAIVAVLDYTSNLLFETNSN